MRGSARLAAAAVAVLVLLGACAEAPRERGRPRPGSGTPRRAPSVTPTVVPSGDLILSSSFESPVCGRYQQPGPGCEFGVEGDVEAGPYNCRTGESCVRIQRLSPRSHMGVVAVVPFPEGHAFVGVAHRIPAIPEGAIPERPGFLQLEQLSPTDGTLPGWPVEVRLYPDRTLGLALFRGDDVARADWRVPVDAWFYVVVEVANGVSAPQRMWVYDSEDRLVAKASARLSTRQPWRHAYRTAGKVGGVTSTLVPMYTYADDWYISTTLQEPLHIGADGLPLVA